MAFPEKYFEAMPAVEKAGATSSLALSLLFALVTGGAGAAASIAAKSPTFIKAINKIKEIIELIKKVKLHRKQRKGHNTKIAERDDKPKKDRLKEKEKKTCGDDGCGDGADTKTSSTDFIDDVGRRGGILYSPKKLLQLDSYLEKRGVKLKVGDKHVPLGKAGGFNSEKGILFLRSNPTNYEVWHEVSHFRQYQKIGKEAYLNLPRTKNFNAPEQFVFDMLENSQKRWNALNFEEQQHAIRYIESIGGFR